MLVVVWLAAAMMCGLTTWFSATAVIPDLRAEWSLGVNETAWLTIAVQLGFVAGALVSAATSLPDLFRPQILVFVASVGAASSNVALIFAGDAANAIAFRLATGAFASAIYPPLLKLMATHFRDGRGLALGILVGALTIGSALPHLVGSGSSLAWQHIVLACSILTLIGGALALAIPTGPFPFVRGALDLGHVVRAFRDPALRLANIGYFGHMWELYAMWSWFPIFLGDSFEAAGTDPAAAHLGAFVVLAAGAVGCAVGGILGDRWGRTGVASAAMVASGSCSLAIGAAYGGPPWLVMAIGLLWGITVVADSAQLSTMTTELADPSLVGTALTVQVAGGFALTVVTIWLVPLARDLIGWPSTFALLAPGPALGTLAMIRLRARPEASAIAGGRR